MFAHLGPEALLVSLGLLTALLCPRLGARWFDYLEAAFATLARHRTASILFCGCCALALRLALLPWLPIPRPYINDEFSFLLAADTFAHGRLTNPQHPMWQHLETFHVISHPTYASMYPPLQGVILALGEFVVHQPFWGVWLSVGVMCSTYCWMLQGWLPASWALLGGLLPVLRFGVFSYWDNSYWGGALAATGGALLLGALPRITRRRQTRDALLMAMGIAILANTRPYEGMVLTIVVGVALGTWMVQGRIGWRSLLRRVGLPMFLVLAIAGCATAYYFWRVTGNPLTMPQQMNRTNYAMAPYFYWQKAFPEPAYHYKAIRDFYEVELAEFNGAHSIAGVLVQWLKMAGRSWLFFLSPVLTIPLFMLPRIVRDRRIRFLLIAGAFGIAASALVVFFNINYVAPISCIMLALIVQGMRHLRVWRWHGNPSGLFLVRAIAVICIILVPIEVHILAAPPTPGSWAAIGPERARIAKRLESLPEPQLVLVRYSPNHNPMLEWVYNGADIDHQKIIWARDMGCAQNEELLRYYSTRRVWLLEPDSLPPQIREYPATDVQITARGPN